MFFKSRSNHHGMSYKVCRSVLGIQRDFFRPEITFLTTSGQMAGHILKNRKIDKIAQKSILVKNSKSCRVTDSGWNDDIWPEMGS